MSDTERFAAMSADLDDIDRRIDAMLAERNALLAENEALRERLRVAPALREVVGELRAIHHKLVRDRNSRRWARDKLSDLLRRLDESQEQPTTTEDR